MWRAATRHPFIEGVCRGEVPEEAFRAYIVEAGHLIGASHRLLALVVAKLPHKEGIEWSRISASLSRKIQPGAESRVLQDLQYQMDVTTEELRRPQLVTAGFSAYLLSLGYTGTYKEGLVALLAITFVQESWAERLGQLEAGDPKVAKWIRVHQDRVLGPTLDLIRTVLDLARGAGKKINHKHEKVVRIVLGWEIAFWASLCDYNKYSWFNESAETNTQPKIALKQPRNRKP